MPFENHQRILAVAPEMVEPMFSQLLAEYGEELPDGSAMIKTIGGHWDDVEHTRLRAATFPTTVSGMPLTDGRLAFIALWQADLAASFDRGEIPQAQELTEAELAALTPQGGDV